MDLKELPTLASLEQYERQAQDLLEACEAGDTRSLEQIKRHLSRSSKPPEPENPAAGFTLADAQFALARWYYFESWPKLVLHKQVFATSVRRLKPARCCE